MKTKYIIIGIILFVALGIAAILIFSKDTSELDELPTSEAVSVTNLIEDKPLYDDIVRAGLQILDIQGVFVVIKEMSPSIKRQYDWENNRDLDAFILKGSGSDYMIVVDSNMSEQTAIGVLAHELIHLRQMKNEQLFVYKDEVYWNKNGLLKSLIFHISDVNTPVDIDSMPYELRPWEREAKAEYRQLGREIRTLLTPL